MPNRFEKYRTHHASRRLRGYEYTRAGVYFVTICTHGRACLLGKIIDGEMHLNTAGQIADEEWRRSETLRAEVTLDAYVVMPNHVHGLVIIAPPGTEAPTDPHGYDIFMGDNRAVVATQRAASLPDDGKPVNVKPKSLGAFVRAFKSAATRRINALRGTPGASVWQPSYHDRIVRNAREWCAVRAYIRQNPARWDEDSNHPARL